MKASQLVSRLQELISIHGGLDVYYVYDTFVREMGVLEVRKEHLIKSKWSSHAEWEMWYPQVDAGDSVFPVFCLNADAE